MGIVSQEAIKQFQALMDQVDEPLKRTFQAAAIWFHIMDIVFIISSLAISWQFNCPTNA
ncbi:hypothetical protein Pyn_06273 [Prunus yedoensis var. nudiflora]|uniref:Uncharacterized protein n=1 Tax=Prunus yedoensis var. nudiflora TaxID=2094558 RepID=A0A315AAN9_PRUYE|nr:hypothetical protein Pyn_06273 [Prunus yedoensis var. nudiflora]